MSSNLARPFELPEPERRRGRSFPGLGQDFDHSRQEVRPEARHELCRGRISCRDLEDTGADGFQDTDAVSTNIFGHFFCQCCFFWCKFCHTLKKWLSSRSQLPLCRASQTYQNNGTEANFFQGGNVTHYIKTLNWTVRPTFFSSVSLDRLLVGLS